MINGLRIFRFNPKRGYMNKNFRYSTLSEMPKPALKIVVYMGGV